MKYIDNETSVSLYQHNFTNYVRRQKLNTALFTDGMTYVLKVSVRTGINTFGDLIDSVWQFLNSAFSEGDTLQVASYQVVERSCLANIT